MLNTTSRVVLSLFLAAAAVGCTSTETQGGAESAGATAGRVVDDSVITAKVKSALIADSQTKASQITVETFQGKVQLSGFVDNETSRSRAVQLARGVDGVKDVENGMEVRKN